MVKETYVSFEIAKLLKEKGFNERTLCYYISNGEIRESMCPAPWNNGVMEPIMICAPTQQKAMAWLREIHKVFISIDAHTANHWDGYIDTFEIDIFQNASRIMVPDKIAIHNIYEKAVEAALKYSLENLI